ncbi:MAG: AlkZ-related protein, partial [Anaerolineales bacterium]
LSENYGAPEEDYLTIYEQGRLTQEAKSVYEALLDQGALDTIALRKAARLSSRESDSRFNKALTDLQTDFKIVPVAVAQTGGWRYAFVYDIVARHYPQIVEQARFITEREAHQRLSELYFRS